MDHEDGGAPWWLADMARQTISNALGTLLAALVIFVVGKLGGAFPDVSGPTSAGLAVVGVGAAIAMVWVGYTGQRDDARLLQALTEYEELMEQALRQREQARDRQTQP